MNLRLFIIAVIPAIIFMLAVYLTDKSDREPTKLLLLTYLFGTLAVIPSIAVEEVLVRLNIFPGVFQAAFNAFIVAAMTEEYFKRLVILKLPFRTSYFNEKLDGIVYGVFAHLGFATVENIIYVVFTYTNNPFIGLYRGIFSVPAHGIFGITMGYYLSLSRFDTDKKRKAANLRKSFTVPLLLHGLFDFILMANIPELTLLFIPYVLFLWWTNQKKLSRFVYDSRSRITRKIE